MYLKEIIIINKSNLKIYIFNRLFLLIKLNELIT